MAKDISELFNKAVDKFRTDREQREVLSLYLNQMIHLMIFMNTKFLIILFSLFYIITIINSIIHHLMIFKNSCLKIVFLLN
jgi:hypothetical protein